jgi:hypothetical protein
MLQRLNCRSSLSSAIWQSGNLAPNTMHPWWPGLGQDELSIHLMRRRAALRDDSALFRHDVAFCLGQRQDPAAIQRLKHILSDAAEHAM